VKIGVADEIDTEVVKTVTVDGPPLEADTVDVTTEFDTTALTTGLGRMDPIETTPF
jgi:hypothetical protein